MTLSPQRNRVFIIVSSCWSIYFPCLPTGQMLTYLSRFLQLVWQFFIVGMYGYWTKFHLVVSKSDFYCLLLMIQSKQIYIYIYNEWLHIIYCAFLLKYFCWILPFQLLNILSCKYRLFYSHSHEIYMEFMAWIPYLLIRKAVPAFSSIKGS